MPRIRKRAGMHCELRVDDKVLMQMHPTAEVATGVWSHDGMVTDRNVSEKHEPCASGRNKEIE